MFGVSRLSSWSLVIGDLPAGTYPLPTGPARSRRSALGAAVGAVAEARLAKQGRVGSGLGSCWTGWEQRGNAGKVEGRESYPLGSACGVFLRSRKGPADRTWLCLAKPLRGEETPATQLSKTSHPFPLHSKFSCARGRVLPLAGSAASERILGSPWFRALRAPFPRN